MKVLIVTPAYAYVDDRTTDAVQRSGLPWAKLLHHSDLPRVRSALLSKALDMGAERIIMLDADVVPTPAALKWLAETSEVHATQAVFGRYPLRGRPCWSDVPAYAQIAERAKAPGDQYPLDWGGVGLCAIDARSLERVRSDLPRIREETGATWYPFCAPKWHLTGKGDAEWWPDDKVLCRRLQSASVGLVARADLIAGHALGSLLLTQPVPVSALTIPPAPPGTAPPAPRAEKGTPSARKRTKATPRRSKKLR